jgi:hypothetical protein
MLRPPRECRGIDMPEVSEVPLALFNVGVASTPVLAVPPSPSVAPTAARTATVAATPPTENSKSGTDALSLSGLALILIPVAVGAGITFLVELFKNHNTKDKEDRDEEKKIAAESREEKRQIDKQRRDYERTAAEDIDKEFSSLVRILPDLYRANARADNADELREKSNLAFDEINAKAAGLPAAIRGEILQLAQLLRFADDIGRGRHNPGYHYPANLEWSQR